MLKVEDCRKWQHVDGLDHGIPVSHPVAQLNFIIPSEKITDNALNENFNEASKPLDECLKVEVFSA